MQPRTIFWSEAASCYVDEEANAYSYDGEVWKPRLANPNKNPQEEKAQEMARKKKEEQAEIEVLEALAEEVYPDQVLKPLHYTSNKWEVWDVLDEFFPTKPHLWMTGKYLLRAGKKGDYLEDLRKAAQYLARAISQEKARRGLK